MSVSETLPLPPAPPNAPEPARPARSEGPRLAAAFAAVLAGVALLFAAVLVDLTALERQALEGCEEAMPALQERQRAVLNVERFKRYGAVAVAAHEATARREALLTAQALAFHPSLHFDTDLRERMAAAFATLDEAATLAGRADTRRTEAEGAPLATADRSRMDAREFDRRARELWSAAESSLDVAADRLSAAAGATATRHLDGLHVDARRAWQRAGAAFAGVLALLAAAGWLAWRRVVGPVMGAAAALDGGTAQEVRRRARRSRAASALVRAAERHERTAAERRAALDALVRRDGLAALGARIAGVVRPLEPALQAMATAGGSVGDRTRETATLLEAGRLRRSDLDAHLAATGEAARTIAANATRIGSALEALRVTAEERAQPAIRPVRLTACLHGALNALAAPLASAGVRVTVDSPPDLVAETDAAALGQVVETLVSNALAHAWPAGPGGRLAIRARGDGASVEVRVADDGCGIAIARQATIFEPFATAGPPDRPAGTGLHIAARLVEERLQGTIGVHGDAGAGTAFTVRFPQTPVPHTAAAG